MNIIPQHGKYVMSIAFANYLQNKTGVPKVMLAHQEMFLKNNISYVALFSVKKNILHDRVMLFCMYGLIVDGEFKGIFQMNQILRILNEWHIKGIRMVNIHLHHLMYTNISTISTLLDSFAGVPLKIYLHDYYNMCSNYTLLKDGKTYCGGNGLGGDQCKSCSSYHRSQKQISKIKPLLERNINRITFISPSESTKKIFCRFYPAYKENAIVIPHQKYDCLYRGNLEPIEADERMRIAYLGLPHFHKGWESWNKIVESSKEQKYEFIVFNSYDTEYSGMHKVKIAFSKSNLNAMTDALRTYKVHAVVLWAVWPETYSYTCFEAFSANAFIITNMISGNICDVVVKNNNGIVLDDEVELLELFKNSEKLRKLINEFMEKTDGGPELLYENDAIIEIVKEDIKNTKITECYSRFSLKTIINTPLLFLLNKIYRR